MSSTDSVKQKLEERLVQLEARSQKIGADLRKPGNRDWAEQATERENDAVLERLDEIELSEIGDIRAALGRIERGRYGLCEQCGERIDAGRLEATPVARTCLGCAR